MINEELSGMRREIGQARDLLRDAIEKLTTSFMNINEIVDARSPDARLAADIRKEGSDVITTLQFQDMVDQLLNHTLKRLEAIEQALASGQAGERSGLSENKPVAQRHMDAGDVDLF